MGLQVLSFPKEFDEDFNVTKEGKLPVFVSFTAIKNFSNESKVDVSETPEDVDLAVMEVFLWHAVSSAYEHIGKDNPYKKEDMRLILDHVYQDFLELIKNSYPAQSKKK